LYSQKNNNMNNPAYATGKIKFININTLKGV